jgi:hypothetical protein
VSALAPSVQPTRARGLHAFVIGVAALAVAAGVAGLRLAAAEPVAVSVARAPHLGQAVPTSFGVVSVDQVERLAESNPDRRKLAPQQSELQVAVTMINVRTRAVPFSRRQVSLRIGRDGVPIPVDTASVRSGLLRERTAFRTVYRFVIARAAADLWFAYDDPRGRSILIRLGSGPFPVGLSTAYDPRQHGDPNHHGEGP